MYTKVMVPLDGSPFSEQALACAIGASRRAHATAHLVRVHGTTVPPNPEMPWQLDEQMESTLRQQEHDYLERLAALPRVCGLNVETAVLTGSVP
jgi:nucleotide-binding universal stress UspA family protein